jgi:uncharacterized integral membrane protein
VYLIAGQSAQQSAPPFQFSLGMAELLVIAAIVGLLILVVNRGGRALAAIVLGGVGLLFAFAAVSMLLYMARSRGVQMADGPLYPLPPRVATVHSAPTVVAPRPVPVPEISGSIPVELEVASSPSATQPGAVQPAETPAPAWVGQPARLSPDGAYQAEVVIGPYEPTDPEIQRRLARDLRAALDDYVEAHLGEGASRRVQFSAVELRDMLVRETWEEPYQSETPGLGPMVRIHAQLTFDDAARRRIEQRHRDTVVESRLAYTGTIAGLALAVLAALFGYLKLDTLTRGFYSGRLKAAAGAVILAAVAVGVMLYLGEIGF